MTPEQTQVVEVWVAGHSPGEMKPHDQAGYGFVYQSDHQEQSHEEYARLGQATGISGFEAEYEALIHALRTVERRFDGSEGLRVEAYTAEKSVVGQVTAGYDTKPRLHGYRDEVQEQLDEFDEASLSWAPRESSPLQRAFDLAHNAVTEDSRTEDGDDDG